jgi:prepilin-type N-terminal cleavage/methylation domain-containing protein
MELRDDNGFTLIELAIVLVIIGLIIGGIVVGRDMIHQAELRKVITQTDQIITAIDTFQGKYNCLPGDCANASDFFPSAVNGNGDEIINYGYPPGTELEGLTMWNHLSQAGLIAGSFQTNPPLLFALTDVPNGPFGNSFYMVRNVLVWGVGWQSNYTVVGWTAGGMPIATRPVGTSWLTYAGFNTSFSPALNAELTPLDAYSIDVKLDDGLPNTGRIGALDVTNFCTSDLGNPGTLTAGYNLSDSNVDCVLMRQVTNN